MIYFKVNPDKKKEYIASKGDNKTYIKLLQGFDDFEKLKDSCVKFKKSDYEEYFLSLNTNLSVLSQHKTVINGYLEFINNVQGVNYLKEIDLGKLYIDIQLITKKEYLEIINGDGNFQDKAVIVLLWNKIKGYLYSEIKTLKYKDLDLENNIINVGGEYSRKVPISQDEMDILVKAYNEKEYFNYQTLKKNPLKESNLLIRPVLARINKYNNDKNKVVTALDNRLSVYINYKLKRKKLRGGNIYKSSIYYDIIQKNGTILGCSDFEKYIKGNKYGISISRYKEQIVMQKKLEQEENNYRNMVDSDSFEDTELANDILDMNKDDVIFNFNIKKEYVDYQLSKFNTDKFESQKTEGNKNSEHQNSENNDDEISKDAKYHLGICGEQLIHMLLEEKDEELFNELGLKATNKPTLEWYNEPYTKDDKDWKDKSIGKGHDIKVIAKDKTLYLEVKTSYSSTNFYELTSNEIKANYDYKDNYYVIKIMNMKYVNSNNKKKPIITVIQNPLKLVPDTINLVKNINFFV